MRFLNLKCIGLSWNSNFFLRILNLPFSQNAVFTSCRSCIATKCEKKIITFLNLTIITFLMKKSELRDDVYLQNRSLYLPNSKCLAVWTLFLRIASLRLTIIFSVFSPNWKKFQLRWWVYVNSQFWGNKFTIAACKLRTEIRVYISQLLPFPLKMFMFSSHNSVFLFLQWNKKKVIETL